MSSNIVPTQESVQNLLTQILGPDVMVTNSSDFPFETGAVATYVSDKKQEKALCIANTGMAVLAGSAFLNLSSSEAHAMLLTGDIHKQVFQSYEEIANILTRVLCDDGYDHLRLEKVHPFLPISECGYSLSSFEEKVSFDIHIPNYGAGVLQFHVR